MLRARVAARPAARLHSVSPGTVVFHDLTAELQNPRAGLLPAAVLICRVVSHPAPGLVTLDAGSKSLAAEAGPPFAAVLGRPRWGPLRCSEEHCVVDVGADAPPPRGTLVALVPKHVCPTVNLAEEAVVVSSAGSARFEPVAARAHDMRP